LVQIPVKRFSTNNKGPAEDKLKEETTKVKGPKKSKKSTKKNDENTETPTIKADTNVKKEKTKSKKAA